MSKVKKGFTLAELLMAMWVMSIILAAVATLSFALGSANDSADNTSDIYSRIRYATMRINELVRNSKLICYNSGTSVTIWRSDDNGNNLINPGEVVSLEIGTSGDSINLVSFQPSAVQADISVPFGLALSASIKGWMAAKAIPSNSVTLVNNCSYVSFTTDEPPPFTEKLNVSFGVKQKGVSRDYQIAAKLRCYAGYLLGKDGLTLLDGEVFDVPTVPVIPVEPVIVSSAEPNVRDPGGGYSGVGERGYHGKRP